MSVNVVETTRSRQDLVRILQYFVDSMEDATASRFVDGHEATLRFIADFPELGIPWESDEKRLQKIRIKPIEGFEKYLVFYRFVQDTVYILRIFHGHQDIEKLL